MFAAGLVEEVRGLVAKYGTLSRTAMQAVGYREVIEYLEGSGEKCGVRIAECGMGIDAGHSTSDGRPSLPPSLPPSISPSLADCINRVKARTRQFARRQETWFRSLSECQFVPMQQGVPPEAVAAKIVRNGERSRLTRSMSAPGGP